jgi:S1-C subfamily serine protease
MKKTFTLCVLAAILGAAISTILTGPADSGIRAAAQDQAELRVPAPQIPVGPVLQSPQPNESPRSILPRQPQIDPSLDELTPEERVNIAVYENVNRSVVNITTKGYHGDRILFMEVPSEGEGSGSIIDRQGNILTNYHVVEGSQEIEVTLFNNKSYDARIVGFDASTDVAVIKITAPAEELFPVVFGDSSRLRVGQRVYAIGNPFGLDRTLSTGIVSSLDRWLPRRRKAGKISQIIQIDASINPGNSGGPLLDSRSRMIGMNTAIASKSGESNGVGFAIPINTIARVVPQLLQRGRVIRPEIGIARVYQTERGLLIATLTPGGAAERAGLHGPRTVRQRQGPFVYQTVDRTSADLIVAVDGKRIRSADDLLEAIEAKQPGQQVFLTIARGGREMNLPVVLDAGE